MTPHAQPALLEGKVIFVSGAGRGIGAAAARVFAGYGAHVMLMSRTEDDLVSVCSHIEAADGSAAYTVGAVDDPESIGSAIEATVRTFGRLDGAFNNAGLALRPGLTVDVLDDEFDAVVATNLRATWIALREEVRAIRRTSGSGSIVNNSSIGSMYGNAGRGVYSATKRAINSLTATIAVEHGHEGIRINSIAPGMTMTPMVQLWSQRDPALVADMTARTPLRRYAEPEEVAEAAAWLLSDRASFVTGIVLPIDGGLRA